jgi:serine/threonine protein phosphatase PrpC
MSELAGLPDLAAAADALLQAALDAGAPDNVSLVLVAVEPAEGRVIRARLARPRPGGRSRGFTGRRVAAKYRAAEAGGLA